jgi:Tfp pilus assembly protein PilV
MKARNPFAWVRRAPAARAGRGGRGARRRRRLGSLTNQSGLTIIEILVSVVVLAIVVAPMFDAFVRGRALVMHRAEERMALRLVERKVEQLLAAGGAAAGADADITSTNMTTGTHPTDSTITLMTKGDNDPSNDVIGDLTWTVSSITWSDPGGVWDDASYKNVVVTLSWPQNQPRDSVSISTIIN